MVPAERKTRRAGQLFYLVGPSGVGKDTVIAALRACTEATNLYVAQRYITRSADTLGENHIPLDNAELTRRERNGELLFAWQSHGLRYAIGQEAATAVARGQQVLVNGSRAYLEAARQHYPSLIAIALDASDAELARRLRERGRENEASIQTRLERARALRRSLPLDTPVIRNDGPIEQAVEQLRALMASSLPDSAS